MAEYLPKDLRDQLTAIGEEIFKSETYESLNSQLLVEAYESLAQLPLELLKDHSVTFEDDMGVHALLPVANGRFGVLCELLTQEGTKSYVIVMGSLFIPGINNEWRDIIETKDEMQKVVYGKTFDSSIILNTQDSTGFVFAKSICSDCYLVTTPAFIGDVSLPYQIIDPELGYSDPTIYYHFSTLDYDTEDRLLVSALLGADLSPSRIRNIRILDDDGAGVLLPTKNE